MSNSNGDVLLLSGQGGSYVRISSDKQDVERQYVDLIEFEKKHKVKVGQPHRYEDHMARDLADKRPDFQRMLKAAKAGTVQWIWIQRIDRFGVEDGYELVELVRGLRKAGCKLLDNSGTDWTTRDLLTLIRAGLAGEQSRAEQVEKSFRSLDGKVKAAKAGEWQGGPPQLGFDIGCFDRATDAELWRVVFEGRDTVRTEMRRGKERPVYHIRRLRVYPDGRNERFDGKVVFKTNPDVQVLRITPTRNKAKLAAAEGVFRRYANEAVSYFDLAKWLNGLGIRNSFGNPFQARDIARMLRDESYLGFPTFSKRHKGRFHRYDANAATDSKIRELEPEFKGRDTESDPEDVIRSSIRHFEPMVERPTWDAVRRKLRSLEKPKYAPRNAGMYLAGIVVCAGCGKPMIARADRGEYFCSSWSRQNIYGPLAASPCFRNGVKQAVLEEYVGRYLDETGKRLELLTASPDGKHLTDRLEEQAGHACQQFCEGISRLTAYLAEHHPEEYTAILREDEFRQAEKEVLANDDSPPLPPGTLAKKLGKRLAGSIQKVKQFDPADLPPGDFVGDCLACYRSNFDPAALTAEIEALEAEHTALMAQWGDLPTPRAKEKAREWFAALEARIDELRRQQEDASECVERHYREMLDLHYAVEEARRTMRSEADAHALRQRAEALRGILCRIDCEFVVTGKTTSGPGDARSKLVALKFVPIVGAIDRIDVNVLSHSPVSA